MQFVSEKIKELKFLISEAKNEIKSFDEKVEDSDLVNVIQKLFEEIAPRFADRPGGYTRMVKIGKRPGDNAEMAVLMLVDED